MPFLVLSPGNFLKEEANKATFRTTDHCHDFCPHFVGQKESVSSSFHFVLDPSFPRLAFPEESVAVCQAEQAYSKVQ